MATVMIVVGTRPNFMKAAPLVTAFDALEGLSSSLVHTGQHYDPALSDLLFRDLGLRRPDHQLGVAGGDAAAQLGRLIPALDSVLAEVRPAAVVVVGDVTSTLAATLAAMNTDVPLIHVEAGLRSFDRRMPEERNRVLTDAVSDLLFCTEQSGLDNLAREGRPGSRVFLVGNVMIDTLLRLKDRAAGSGVLRRLGLSPHGYALLTLHRPSNVDDRAALEGLLEGLEELCDRMPVVFPVHPRTRARIVAHGLESRLAELPGLRLLDPQPYLGFVGLMIDAAVVITDSGGIQEETTILGRPCLTLRENTERPVTCELGTNRLVPLNPGAIEAACADALKDPRPNRQAPPLWDGRAGERIAAIVQAYLGGGLEAARGAALAAGGDPSSAEAGPEGPRCEV